MSHTHKLVAIASERWTKHSVQDLCLMTRWRKEKYWSQTLGMNIPSGAPLTTVSRTLCVKEANPKVFHWGTGSMGPSTTAPNTCMQCLAPLDARVLVGGADFWGLHCLVALHTTLAARARKQSYQRCKKWSDHVCWAKGKHLNPGPH